MKIDTLIIKKTDIGDEIIAKNQSFVDNIIEISKQVINNNGKVQIIDEITNTLIAEYTTIEEIEKWEKEIRKLMDIL